MVLAMRSAVVAAMVDTPPPKASRTVDDATICTIVRVSPDAYHPQRDVQAAAKTGELEQVIGQIEADISHDMSTRLMKRVRDNKRLNQRAEPRMDFGMSSISYYRFGKPAPCSSADIKIFVSIGLADSGQMYLVTYRIETAIKSKTFSFRKPVTYVTDAGRPQYPLEGIEIGQETELSTITKYIRSIFDAK